MLYVDYYCVKCQREDWLGMDMFTAMLIEFEKDQVNIFVANSAMKRSYSGVSVAIKVVTFSIYVQ